MLREKEHESYTLFKQLQKSGREKRALKETVTELRTGLR
jgi:hypothetical protein